MENSATRQDISADETITAHGFGVRRVEHQGVSADPERSDMSLIADPETANVDR